MKIFFTVLTVVLSLYTMPSFAVERTEQLVALSLRLQIGSMQYNITEVLGDILQGRVARACFVLGGLRSTALSIHAYTAGHHDQVSEPVERAVTAMVNEWNWIPGLFGYCSSFEPGRHHMELYDALHTPLGRAIDLNDLLIREIESQP